MQGAEVLASLLGCNGHSWSSVIKDAACGRSSALRSSAGGAFGRGGQARGLNGAGVACHIVFPKTRRGIYNREPMATEKQSEKSWQARICEATDAIAQTFVESISYDWRLYQGDVAGRIAPATI